MKIKTDEITSVIKQEIEQYAAELEVSEVGRVVEVGDGIARIYGLWRRRWQANSSSSRAASGAVMGQVFNLEARHRRLPSSTASTWAVKEGDLVKATGRLLEVPVGEALLGRVVNPLGQPLDDGPRARRHRDYRKVDIIAPGIAERQPVTEPMQTGDQGDRLHDP